MSADERAALEARLAEIAETIRRLTIERVAIGERLWDADHPLAEAADEATEEELS